MPKYQYKARNMSGRIMEGVYEAPNPDAVINMIRQKSYYHLEVNEIIERKDINEMGALGRIKPKELSVYCRQFSSILKAGVPLIQCLGMLSEQTENKILRSITGQVRDEVQKGSGLSEAMSHHQNKLPPILINMVSAGEASGTLDHSLEVMSIHFEKDHKTRSKIKSALRYPIIVGVVAVVVVIALLIFVVPVFVDMFANSGQKLPLPTRILIGASDYLKENGIILLVILIVILGTIKLVLAGENQRKAYDKFRFKMPIFGPFLRKSATAVFSRNMASLMSTGVSITEALDITGRVIGNSYALDCMQKIVEQVKEGKGLYQPIVNSHLFPPMLENMVLLGEESGTLDDMLRKTADFFEDEVDIAAESLTALLQPIIIAFLGFIVAFIVMSIALPMFDSMGMAS